MKLKVSPEDKEKIARAMKPAHKCCLLSRAIKGNVEELIDYEFIEKHFLYFQKKLEKYFLLRKKHGVELKMINLTFS